MINDGLVQELIVVEKVKYAGGEDENFEHTNNQQNLFPVWLKDASEYRRSSVDLILLV
jgi:hypothetical protein